MNELKVFSSTEFGELGVMLIDGKEYFPATQCAVLLGYKNPQEAIREKCKGVRKTLTPTNGGTQAVNYIPEGDLYRLIVSSKLPAAEKFERWVFDEVLPQIRRNGGYIGNVEEIIARTATAVVSEVMKQITPLLQRQSPYYDPLEELRLKAIVSPQPRHKVMCTIKRLDTELRKQVDEMILSDRYSYDDIRTYLARFGIKEMEMMFYCVYETFKFNDCDWDNTHLIAAFEKEEDAKKYVQSKRRLRKSENKNGTLGATYKYFVELVDLFGHNNSPMANSKTRRKKI